MASEKSKDNGKRDESNPEYENFQQGLRQILSVSKEELDKRRAEYERERQEKRSG